VITLSAISSDRWLGRALRWPLRWLPREFTAPILQGPIRGKRWVVGSSTHDCWLGIYEYEKCRLFARMVRPGDVVYDIGANAGFYTLLASVLVGPTDRVVAFEPSPRNLAYLNRHLTVNEVNNVTVVAGAVYDDEGDVRLLEGPDSHLLRVDVTGTLRSRSLTLDHLVFRDDLPPPTVMKIDVEGSEYAVFQGGKRVLAEHRPLIFLSTHGARVHTNCCRLLVELGYTLRPLVGERLDEVSEVIAQASVDSRIYRRGEGAL
jgi:FkbM family methyltransferase